jgi:hypothetical protein
VRLAVSIDDDNTMSRVMPAFRSRRKDVGFRRNAASGRFESPVGGSRDHVAASALLDVGSASTFATRES